MNKITSLYEAILSTKLQNRKNEKKSQKEVIIFLIFTIIKLEWE